MKLKHERGSSPYDLSASQWVCENCGRPVRSTNPYQAQAWWKKL